MGRGLSLGTKVRTRLLRSSQKLIDSAYASTPSVLTDDDIFRRPVNPCLASRHW